MSLNSGWPKALGTWVVGTAYLWYFFFQDFTKSLPGKRQRFPTVLGRKPDLGVDGLGSELVIGLCEPSTYGYCPSPYSVLSVMVYLLLPLLGLISY